MIHLLLVDDEPAILQVGRAFLEDHGGISVDVAESADEAIDLIRSRRYDVVVSDYEMPQTNGITFLKAVRQFCPGMPFILFTGRGREEVAIEALNSGADYYLQKGGDAVAQFTELTHKVRQAVNRRRTERALKESEKNYRHLVENLPNILFKTDREGRITYLNRCGLEALGVTTEEVIGKNWNLFLHPEDRKTAWEQGTEMIRSGEPVINHEARVLRDRNEEEAFPVLLTFSALRNSDDQFIGLQGIAVDISERKKAQEALRKAETKYRIIAEGIYDGVTVGEKDGTITFASPSMQRIIGYRPEEMVGHLYPEFVRGPDHEKIQNHFRRTIKGECFEGLQVQVIQKDGGCIDIEMNGGPVYNPKGEIVGAQSIMRDVTIQRSAEQALRESEERLNVTLRSIGDGVVVTDAEGQVVMLNSVAEGLTGWPEEEVLGQPLDEVFIISEINHRPAENPVKRVIETGRVVGLANHTTLIARDGTERLIADSAAPIRGRDGKIVGVVLVFRDVTAEKEAEADRLRLAAIVESSEDAIFGTDLEGVVTNWNSAAQAIYGYTPEEAIGRHVSEFAPDGRKGEFMGVIERIKKGEKTGHYESKRARKDRSEIEVSITISSIRDEEDSIIGFSAISRDITQRNEAVRALRESEERLNVTLRSIGDGVVVTDAEGQVVMLNSVAEGLTGWPEEEALGRPLDEVFIIINEINRRPAENPVKRVIETGLVVGLANHTALIARDGTERLIADSAAPIRGRDGKIVGVVLVFRDVTAEKEAEADRLRLAAIVESSEDAIFGTDLEGFVTSWNSAAQAIYGYTPEEAIGRHVSEFVPDGRKGEFMGVIERIKKGEKTGHYESRRLRKDGSEIEASITISPIRDEEGSIMGFSAISRDITRRNEAVRALKESEETMNLVIEGADLGMWDWDPLTGELLFNRIYEEMLGYAPDELERSDRLWSHLIHPEDFPRVQEIMQRHLDGDSPYYHAEFRMKRKDGHWAWIQGQGKVVQRSSSALALRMTGIHEDITEVRSYEEALKKANKKLNILNGITRHDIVNQIMALQGYLYLIRKSAGADRALAGRVESCMDLTEKIKRQISFTRDYEHMGVKAPEWQNLEAVVRQAAGDLALDGIALTIAAGPLEIFADPMLQKAVFNLLENSVRHGNGISEVRVSFRESGDGGILVIEDDGAGVPVEHKPHIFEAGFGRNTGYGLFLVKEILDITGMAIAETGCEGEGARFEITVPEGKFRTRAGG